MRDVSANREHGSSAIHCRLTYGDSVPTRPRIWRLSRLSRRVCVLCPNSSRVKDSTSTTRRRIPTRLRLRGVAIRASSASPTTLRIGEITTTTETWKRLFYDYLPKNSVDAMKCGAGGAAHTLRWRSRSYFCSVRAPRQSVFGEVARETTRRWISPEGVSHIFSGEKSW